MSAPMERDRSIRLHDTELRGNVFTAYISVPAYDSSRPTREVGGGTFMRTDARGILVSVTEPDDFRAVAAALIEAADRIDPSAPGRQAHWVGKSPDVVMPGDYVRAPQAHRMEGRMLGVTDVRRPDGSTWVLYVEDQDDPEVTGEIKYRLGDRVQVLA